MASKDWRAVLAELIRPYQDNVALVIKQSQQVLFRHRERVVLPSASLIKLPILVGVLTAVKQGRVHLTQPITPTNEELVGGSGVLQLLPGKTWQLQELLALMIADSDNTATNLVIETVGLSWLQAWLVSQPGTVQLGRKLMDFEAAKAGQENLITAETALQYFQSALKPTWPQYQLVQQWFEHQQFRDKLPGAFDELEWPLTVVNKTGEDQQIDHDVARFLTPSGEQLDIAMLTVGISDRPAVLQLFNQVGKLLAELLINDD